MNRRWITALILASAAPTAWGYGYQAQTGALSYSFFNLSPNQITLTPYGGGANPLSPITGAPALTQGWGNASGTVGFFNPTKISGGTCNNPSTQVQDNVFFYQEEDVPINVATAYTLSIGTGWTVVEYSTEIEPVLNPPAIADSWAIGASVIAMMASPSNMFISGIEGGNNYPFCASQQGLWYNAMLLPPVAANWQTSTVNTPAGQLTQQNNPLAPGFTSAGMNLNVDPNASGYVPTGGLWSGVYNPNATNLAIDSLNLPMYPVNLSAYIGSDEVNNGIDQYASPIYGGHLTLAIGDPFLVSSYAAKILWFLVTNTDYAFSDNSLSTGDIQHIENLVLDDNAGVFVSSSYSQDYAAWLLAAPGQAASALSTMNTAASTPITKESIWGKVFSGLVDVAVDVAAAAVGTLAGPEASVAVEAAATVGEGAAVAGGEALTNYSTNQITADFTTTVSLPPPVAQTAPPVINPSYSSNDLLGMLLTNVFVQAEVNNGLTTSPNPSSFALWSNYTISTETLCSGIGVTNNLFFTSGGCGSQSGSPPTYDNVLSLYPSSYDNAALNPWSAILTGADVTASNGFLQLGSPSTAVFQPPTQLVNLTGAYSLVSGVDLGFALDSGMLGIASYTVSGQVFSTWTGYPPSLQLSQAGTWTGTEWTQAPVSLPIYSKTATTAPGYWYFNQFTGAVTVTGLQIGAGPGLNGKQWAAYAQPFGNGPQTLASTSCAAGASVVITVTPTSTTSMDGSLSCGAVTHPPGGAGVGIPATAPVVNLIVASPTPPDHGIGFVTPDASLISYDSNSGLLTVAEYQGYYANNGTEAAPNAYPFANAPTGLTLNLADCAAGSAVNLFLYPSSVDSAGEALGYLTCANGPPVMPYSLCTSDPNATGGIVIGLNGAPTSADGSGATFDLGCVCIPQYLGGIGIDYAATTPSSGEATFWQTSGGGNPQGGLMVGASASNPHGSCN